MTIQLFLYVFFAALFSIYFNILNRQTLKDFHDSTVFAWWFEFIRVLIFLPFLYFDRSFDFSRSDVLLFMAIGVSEFFSVYFFMKMHSHSELSISTIISQLRLIWLPIMAFIFLGERLKTAEYLGVGLIFLGQLLTLFRNGIRVDKGAKYAILSSIFVASNSVISKLSTPHLSPQVIVVAMGIPSIFLFPILMKDGFERISKSVFLTKKLFIGVVFNAFSMLLLLVAIKYGDVTKILGLFQSLTVLSVAVGIFFLNEKENITWKLFGGISVLLGMILLI